ncbi:MAG: hypothetical protein KF830_10015 [Planctomycetes bacterium]|nr:hypothetical protein [Planctomycetota bacterium]
MRWRRRRPLPPPGPGRARGQRAAWAATFAGAAACAGPLPPAAAEPWTLLASPTTASLRALAVVDARIAWVGGSDGALWRTEDGGASWRAVAPPGGERCDFRDLEAFGATAALAMVAGQPARVYRTEDAGRTWTVVLADARPEAFFDALAFAGENGFLVADPIDGGFGVWRSADAGRTWRHVDPAALPAATVGEACFAASGACAAVGDDAAAPAWVVTGGSVARCLWLPADGAPRAVALPMAQGAATRGAFALAVRGQRLVVVGGDYADPQAVDGTAACSADGGATWQSAPGAGGYRSAVCWLDGERVLATGPNGTCLSTDGGRRWQPVSAIGFHSLARAADGSVWACGAAGRIARFQPDRLSPARRDG